MKCPECEANHPVSKGMQCGCGYSFCFNPKLDKMTDGRFRASIRSASANDTYYFTEKQLYAALCTRMKESPLPALFTGLFFFAVAVGLGLAEWTSSAFICGIIGAVGLVCAMLAWTKPMLTPTQFSLLLDKWRTRKDSLPKLISEPGLHKPPPEWTEPDIYDYGVERILIVQRDILVDLFVLNGQHTQQRALIISENQYPDYLIPIAKKCLEEKPDLPIYLLHDATPFGQSMEERLRQEQWLPIADHPVLDMGIHPEQVKQMSSIQKTGLANAPETVPIDVILFSVLAIQLSRAMDQAQAMQPLTPDQATAGHFADHHSFG